MLYATETRFAAGIIQNKVDVDKCMPLDTEIRQKSKDINSKIILHMFRIYSDVFCISFAQCIH